MIFEIAFRRLVHLTLNGIKIGTKSSDQKEDAIELPSKRFFFDLLRRRGKKEVGAREV